MRPLVWVVLSVILLAASILLLCSTEGPFRFVNGEGVGAAAANARLWNCHVPDDATDVWYKSGYRATFVECFLGPESFKQWCHKRGWRVMPIDEKEPQHVFSRRYDSPILVSKGLYFAETERGYFGVYDEEKQWAYVQYSGN